jgi:hypothetical protein
MLSAGYLKGVMEGEVLGMVEDGELYIQDLKLY